MGKKVYIFLILIIFILLISSYFVYAFSFKDFFSKLLKPKELSKEIKIQLIPKIPESEQEIADNCKGRNLENTAKCLTENIKPFFKYNWNNNGQKLSFKRLRDEGGVCWQWADLYISLARSLNFNTNRVSLNLGQGFFGSHTILFINDNAGYCILDMVNYDCFKFVNSTGT